MIFLSNSFATAHRYLQPTGTRRHRPGGAGVARWDLSHGAGWQQGPCCCLMPHPHGTRMSLSGGPCPQSIGGSQEVESAPSHRMPHGSALIDTCADNVGMCSPCSPGFYCAPRLPWNPPAHPGADQPCWSLRGHLARATPPVGTRLKSPRVLGAWRDLRFAPCSPGCKEPLARRLFVSRRSNKASEGLPGWGHTGMGAQETQSKPWECRMG